MMNSMQNLFRSHGIGVDNIVDAAVIASGSGTTAEIYMAGARDGWIPGVNIRVLISTKENAGCIEKAKNYDVLTEVVNRKEYSSQEKFNATIEYILHRYVGVELVYFAGCNQEVYSIPGIYFANNHPGPKNTDGGRGMYATMLHEHVLLGIKDKILRYPHLINEVHRTCIDHHEAISRDSSKKGMDIGEPLMRSDVDIPPFIIEGLMDGSLDPKTAAEKLQQHVMKYEYMMIVSAAISDAERVRDAKEYGIKLGGF